jgi:hypothetical protein
MKYKGIPIHEIVIYKHPLIYLQLCGLLVVDLLKWLKNFIIHRCLFIIALVLFWGLITHIQALNVLFFIISRLSNKLFSLHFIG